MAQTPETPSILNKETTTIHNILLIITNIKNNKAKTMSIKIYRTAKHLQSIPTSINSKPAYKNLSQ